MAESVGLESGVVRVAEYDARWPLIFISERQRILDQCGALGLRLEHIGGTSILGMCAKPVIDIAAGRRHDTSTEDCVAALNQAGYEHRGERGVPGREFFLRGEPRKYHLHLVEDGGALWRDYLVFRDYLRAHAETARYLADLKRVLAARFPHDREAYMNAKAPHVQDILALALASDERTKHSVLPTADDRSKDHREGQ